MFAKRSINSLSMSVTEENKSKCLNARLAVLPSFEVPEPPCLGKSTLNPNSSMNLFCMIRFFFPQTSLSSLP